MPVASSCAEVSAEAARRAPVREGAEGPLAHEEGELKTGPLVCTIGHSTHPIAEFISLLRANEVRHVLDVRTVPRSRKNPQFNQKTLPAVLHEAGIRYTHLPGLGGLRHAQKDSINRAWRNLSFRGYADYMQTAEFAENTQRVMELAESERCVLMCAEAVPWRCHRSLIGDALLVRGARVEDIISGRARTPHKMTPWAQADGLRVFYPLQEAVAGSDPNESE